MLQICAVGWRSLLSHLMQWSSERNLSLSRADRRDGQRRDLTRSWWIEVGWMDHEQSWHDSAWPEDLHGGRVWWLMAKEFYKISAHCQTSVAAMQRRPAVHQQKRPPFFVEASYAAVPQHRYQDNPGVYDKMKSRRSEHPLSFCTDQTFWHLSWITKINEAWSRAYLLLLLTQHSGASWKFQRKVMWYSQPRGSWQHLRQSSYTKEDHHEKFECFFVLERTFGRKKKPAALCIVEMSPSISCPTTPSWLAVSRSNSDFGCAKFAPPRCPSFSFIYPGCRRPVTPVNPGCLD